ncbi:MULTISPECIES: hypothetical protein [Burkholderia]|nr:MULTISPECIES: hypothetical protein [Burkholderia]MDP9542868.1 hypothetical protein [Burkholderia cepacia]MBR8389654.1 hypothetical protein [Burkholderia cenocepacia]MBR8468012.1 hypothetical protein [Burkholderia cenocepacia]MBR8488472.1 hypothetical protein [Burkholderia cenocepacia]MDO5918662.1 hypothetical protein [Burkholderia cenocepacia]
MLTPRFVGLFNEAYRKELVDKSGDPLRAIPIVPGIRADMVAEFAFWAARLLHDSGRHADDLLDQAEIVQEASRMAFEVVQKYEGAKPDPIEPLTPPELSQGVALASNYASLYRACLPADDVEFSPRFEGCGFLNAAEGDLGINGTLVEIKTTTRNVSGKDLRQLITYLALDAGAGRQRWSHVAVFNPRRGTFHRAEIDALLLRLSGGKPRVDVLGDVVEFVQTTEFVNDRAF